MYVKTVRKPQRFPPGYNGTLLNQDSEREIAKPLTPEKNFKVRKNKFCEEKKVIKNDDKIDFSNDDLLLLGLLVFLYVGCEHSKENLILMGVIAYLLFYGK